MTVLQIRRKPKKESRVFVEHLYENKKHDSRNEKGGLFNPFQSGKRV